MASQSKSRSKKRSMKHRKTVRKQRGSGIFVKSTVLDIINNRLNLDQLKLLQIELSDFKKYADYNLKRAAQLAGECPSDDIKCYRKHLSDAYSIIRDKHTLYRDYNNRVTEIPVPKHQINNRNLLVDFLKTIYHGYGL